MLNMMKPSYKQKLIDVACGTGDMALFLKNVDEVMSNYLCRSK